MSEQFICSQDFAVTGLDLAVTDAAHAPDTFDLEYTCTVDINDMLSAYEYENVTDAAGGSDTHTVTYASGSTDDSHLQVKFAEIFSRAQDKPTLASVDGTQNLTTNTAALASDGTSLADKDEKQIMVDAQAVAFFSDWRAQNFTSTSVNAQYGGTEKLLSNAMKDDAKSTLGDQDDSWIATLMNEAHCRASATAGNDANIVGRTEAVAPHDDNAQGPHKYKLKLIENDELSFRFLIDFSAAKVVRGTVAPSASTVDHGPHQNIVEVSLRLKQSA